MITGANAVHLTRAQLDAGLGHIRNAPAEQGELKLIVRRPATNQREVIEVAELDTAVGLVGDTWASRSSNRTLDGTRHPDMQINIMNARVIELIARTPERWPLAGDQLYVDLDLSETNLPPRTQLAIGATVVEVTPEPHTGCAKFVERFGLDAMKFVNAPLGRSLRLRGLNARVVKGGTIRAGDPVTKLPARS